MRKNLGWNNIDGAIRSQLWTETIERNGELSGHTRLHQQNWVQKYGNQPKLSPILPPNQKPQIRNVPIASKNTNQTAGNNGKFIRTSFQQ